MSVVTPNSGYVGYSMSVRACEAYDEGEMPKSKWTKAKMIEAVHSACEEFEVEYPDNLAKLKRDEIFAHLFTCSSWHHTSMMCNETDFYAVSEKRVKQLSEERVSEWIAKRDAKKEQDTRSGVSTSQKREYARISFTEWIGSRNHRQPREQLGWGEIVGDWCHLIEPSVGGCGKKKVRGTGCEIAKRFSTEEAMLDDRAVILIGRHDGKCVSTIIDGERCRAFVKGIWLYIVEVDGTVRKKKAYRGGEVAKLDDLMIGELRREKSPQSLALLKLYDEERKKRKR